MKKLPNEIENSIKSMADVCSYDNINMYLLKYEQNGAYKLITSEDCIVLS